MHSDKFYFNLFMKRCVSDVVNIFSALLIPFSTASGTVIREGPVGGVTAGEFLCSNISV